jgi:hypothetical protein
MKMLRLVSYVGLVLLPIAGWLLLRRSLGRAGEALSLDELPIVYVHWSILACFGVLGAFNVWSGLQLLTLVYLVALAAPAAVVASFFWRKKRRVSPGQRLTSWMTALFAPAVALLLGALYVTAR